MFNLNSVKKFSLISIFTLLTAPVIAHNVEISNEVAATFHIEPNHNPRAGNKTKAWFALTRRGGKSIPLSECNCELNVYAVPRTADAQPILQPELKAIDVEKYQQIPGADIVFPSAGAYVLEISGTATDQTSFSPFDLTYTVNVRP
ncbi:hypothetical protein [Pleurocapsa sp. PCC 7319]|uniref:hypothetical protein n=1 Tax=Pleurocapsa sp. PCC 7319 TaxID=118161 RepID=UPI0003750EC8|nr:hypothetical protein [Pleurocapsa sp. PCC 7319]